MAASSDTLFLVSTLIIDTMENQSSRAAYYVTVGYVETEEMAQGLVAAAGDEIGTGWPIPRGEKMPKRIYMRINRADMVTQDHD